MGDGFHPEEWVYCGRYYPDRGAIPWHRFQKPDGKEFVTTVKPGAGVIGGIYTVEVSEDGERARVKTATYDGKRIDDTHQIAAWRALDQSVWRRLTRERTERKHTNDNEFDHALAALQRVVNKARTSTEAHKIISMASDRLTDGWYRK